MLLCTLQKTIRTKIQNIFEKLLNHSLVLTEPLRIRGSRLPLFANLSEGKNLNLNIGLIITGADIDNLTDEQAFTNTLSQVKTIDFTKIDMEVEVEVEDNDDQWEENKKATGFISDLLQRTSVKTLTFHHCRHLEWLFEVIDKDRIVKYNSVETIGFAHMEYDGLWEILVCEQLCDDTVMTSNVKVAAEGLSRTYFPNLKQLWDYNCGQYAIYYLPNEHDTKAGHMQNIQ
jgi:hypothetical protein